MRGSAISVADSLIEGAAGNKVFLLGNEAIARGAIEGGVRVATAYPGTPSSEILGTLAKVADRFGIYVEWSTNEKVAFEVALAASYCGFRAMTSMKHVGVNVAHDAFMTSAHIGANGGLVLVSADDPHAWSSQNEQDNRFIARQAYVPVFEPCDPREAKEMTAMCFELSEVFGHPIMLRPTTRVCHAKSDVILGNVSKKKRKVAWERRPDVLVYDSAGARRNRVRMVERFEKICETVDKLPFNRLDLIEGAKFGLISCGLSHTYVNEAVRWLKLENKVSSLKLGVTHPVPKKLIKSLLNSVDKVLVVEELEPFVELRVKAIAKDINPSVEIHGKDLVPLIGELSPRIVMEALAKATGSELPIDYGPTDKFCEETLGLLPRRPPVLCSGCPHRASLYAIKVVAYKNAATEYGKGVKPIFSGDIGCYGLGYLPPLEAVDSIICMGASIGFANGLAHVIKAPIVAIVGDSTFLHAGIPALINSVYNQAKITVAILDNDTTGMTGFQPHPGTGVKATGVKTHRVMIEDVARGCGVDFVEVVDPNDMKRAKKCLERALKHDGSSVVVFRRRCALLELREKRRRGEKITPFRIDTEKCKSCDICVKAFGCPAIVKRDERFLIDDILCTGCGVCSQICPYKAIVKG